MLFVYTSSLQGGEYGTDEEEDEDEEVSPSYPSAIEVFDLAENEDLSPLETDPEKLAHKYKEVMKRALHWILSCLTTEHPLRGTCIFKTVVFFCGKAPDQACRDPGWDPAAETKGKDEASSQLNCVCVCVFSSSPRMLLLSPQLHHAEQEKQRWRMDKAQLEQTLQENKERMEKLEGYWMEAQSLCKAVDEHLKETQSQYQALERKYSKAKRLIKEYQQK